MQLRRCQRCHGIASCRMPHAAACRIAARCIAACRMPWPPCGGPCPSAPSPSGSAEQSAYAAYTKDCSTAVGSTSRRACHWPGVCKKSAARYILPTVAKGTPTKSRTLQALDAIKCTWWFRHKVLMNNEPSGSPEASHSPTFTFSRAPSTSCRRTKTSKTHRIQNAECTQHAATLQRSNQSVSGQSAQHLQAIQCQCRGNVAMLATLQQCFDNAAIRAAMEPCCMLPCWAMGHAAMLHAACCCCMLHAACCII